MGLPKIHAPSAVESSKQLKNVANDLLEVLVNFLSL